MRWCRSQKPAKSTTSVFPIATGCHPARTPENAGLMVSVPAGRGVHAQSVLFRRLCRRQSVVLELLSQRKLLDFSCRCVWDFIDEHDVIGHPPFRDLAL